ncbi:MAG TPA: extracellular solute-binding protein [Pseudonocardia sp.]|nr:extracellular solute-binding protein [Pseudonocardia sp.]
MLNWIGRLNQTYVVVVGVALCLCLVAWLLAATRPTPVASWTGELVILSGRDDSTGKQRQARVDLWNEVHPEIPASIVELSGNADQQRNEMVRRAQDPAGRVDIYNLDVTWTAEFAENDYIVPLSGVPTDDFLSRPLDTCLYERRFDGIPFSGEQLWALPFNTDAGLLYYRADLVAPPASWDMMVTETRRVLESPDHDPLLEAGYTTQLDNYEGLTVNVLEALRDVTTTIKVDESGRLPFDGRDLKEVVDRFRVRNENDDGSRRENAKVMLPASIGYEEQRSTQAMREGKTLFLRNWPVAYRTLTARSGESSAAERKFKVAQLPGGSVLGGQNLAVARHSAHPEAATELVRFLTNAPSQRALFVNGGFAATRRSVYDNKDVQAAIDYAGELRSAVENAEPRPEGPCYARFSKILRDAVTAALRGDGSLPDDLVEQLDAALNCRPAP